ncbi:MAG TPA: DEAD/DEAH box helicase, partial [Propionicimonas sp.]|nr:DEAD/DEAH box helicase [Propionicimonas sp.]
MPTPELTGRILTAAIEAIEGDERPGQTEMAAEVARTIESGEHLLVQAGTGTGKSLGYLAPALAALSENPEGRVVIATATLALQAQLANKDIPAAVAACEKVTGKVIRHAVVKGRSNYACLLRVREGGGVEQDALVPDGAATTAAGAEVVALRSWAEQQAIEGDERPGQTEMAAEVARTIDSGEHLLIQAGTGTGKSLGYLAPALA